MSYDDYKFQQPDDSYFADKEKEQCDKCLESFDEEDLFYTTACPNIVSQRVCSVCLHKLHSNF